jgi:hypothetical protein
MARKAKRTKRVSFEKLREQPEGKRYLIATVEGVFGSYSIAAPPPRTAMDVHLQDLVLQPYRPQIIDPEWLKVSDFERMYAKFEAIRLSWSNKIPEDKPGRELPEELINALDHYEVQMAWEVANTPYEGRDADKIDALIGARNETFTLPRDTARWQLDKKIPFLLACREYEERIGNRRKVIKMLDDEIESTRSEVSSVSSLI